MDHDTSSPTDDGLPCGPSHVTVIGGGLAGSEAALQLARRGIPVTLMEMRPDTESPAHHTGDFAELVCSNSFKSVEPSLATGTLKAELELLDSAVLAVAHETSVPAGAALAVDRSVFSRRVTALLEEEPLVTIVRQEATSLPEGDVIIATGPLSSPAFDHVLQDLVGGPALSFFDAAAPIIEGDSVDRTIAFAASRHGKGEAPTT